MALLLGGLAAKAAPQKQHFDLSIRIMPQVVDGRVLNIKVSEPFDQPSTPAGTPLLSMPIITDSVPGVLNDASTLLRAARAWTTTATAG